MKKIISGLAISAVLFGIFTTTASAASIKISGNGSDSYNRVRYSIRNRLTRVQENEVVHENKIEVKSETGDNEVKDNTGGSNSLTTGDVSTTVGISNAGGVNTMNGDDCDCVGDDDADIEVTQNGSDSTNRVKYEMRSLFEKLQFNFFGTANDVETDSDTGDNDVEDNTGGEDDGDVEVTTGGVTTEIFVENVGADNSL